jgi:hypothetical protein
MVKDVEYLCAELQLDPIAERKVSMDREVPFRRTESAKSVPA